jgi:hypothetical protein
MQIANWEGQFCPSFFVGSFGSAVSAGQYLKIFFEKNI